MSMFGRSGRRRALSGMYRRNNEPRRKYYWGFSLVWICGLILIQHLCLFFFRYETGCECFFVVTVFEIVVIEMVLVDHVIVQVVQRNEHIDTLGALVGLIGCAQFLDSAAAQAQVEGWHRVCLALGSDPFCIVLIDININLTLRVLKG